MKFILIIILFGPFSRAPESIVAEFDDQNACIAAEEQITSVARSAEPTNTIQSGCYPKRSYTKEEMQEEIAR